MFTHGLNCERRHFSPPSRCYSNGWKSRNKCWLGVHLRLHSRGKTYPFSFPIQGARDAQTRLKDPYLYRQELCGRGGGDKEEPLVFVIQVIRRSSPCLRLRGRHHLSSLSSGYRALAFCSACFYLLSKPSYSLNEVSTVTVERRFP